MGFPLSIYTSNVPISFLPHLDKPNNENRGWAEGGAAHRCSVSEKLRESGLGKKNKEWSRKAMVGEEGGRELGIWTSTKLDNLGRGNLKKKEKKTERKDTTGLWEGRHRFWQEIRALEEANELVNFRLVLERMIKTMGMTMKKRSLDPFWALRRWWERRGPEGPAFLPICWLLPRVLEFREYFSWDI